MSGYLLAGCLRGLWWVNHHHDNFIKCPQKIVDCRLGDSVPALPCHLVKYGLSLDYWCKLTGKSL